MNLEWSLDELYESFESNKFLDDMKKYERTIETFISWCNSNLNEQSDISSKIEKYITFENEIGELTTLFSFSELTLSVDSENNIAIKILDKLEDLRLALTKPRVTFKTFVKNITNLNEIIKDSNILKEHQFFLNKIRLSSKYMLSEKEEVTISKMKITGSSLWEKLYDQLTSNLLVDIVIDGELKELPISNVRNLAYDINPQVRKNSYECELKSYKKIDKSIAFALNGIKGEVIGVSKLRGYDSVLDMTLIDSRMESSTLQVMQQSIEKYLPIFHKYFKRKAKILNHKNGLPFYDLFAPIGSLDMVFTYEEAKNYIVKNFNTFSKDLGNFAKIAFENRWIDVEPKTGKRDGAFCHNIHPIKESRMLTNFTGSFNDVITLAHELGHAYHDKCLNNKTYINSHYPMPIAETASTFCETIIINSALTTASDEEKFVILENDISGAAQVIVDIYSRFLFEDEVFSKRIEGTLSVDELKDIMLSAQKKAYGDGLDHNFLHPYMWLCKPHYYSSSVNYYNFPYSFGALFAKGLYSNYLDNKDGFSEKYIHLLESTGDNNLCDVAKILNIDLNNPDFWISSLELLSKDIEKFLTM